MEEIFKAIANRVGLTIELIAVVLIACGAIEAVVRLIVPHPRGDTARHFRKRREIFLRFGGWLILGLEFQLAADIIRSAITPTWAEIGQLGAIAAIRTFLNYFLEKDVEKLTTSASADEKP